MSNLIIGVLTGAISVSIFWFFVWKNNKDKFSKTLVDAEIKLKEANNLYLKYKPK